MALLASLLNVICNYDPVGYGMPYVPWRLAATRATQWLNRARLQGRFARTGDRYNYMLFSDHKEALAEVATQARLAGRCTARRACTPGSP